MPILILFYIGVSIVVGYVAGQRGRDGVCWGGISLLVSPIIALLLLIALPVLEIEKGRETSPDWPAVGRVLGAFAGVVCLLFIVVLVANLIVFGNHSAPVRDTTEDVSSTCNVGAGCSHGAILSPRKHKGKK